MLTREELVAVMPRAAAAAEAVTPALNAAMARYGIATPARMAAFLAQLAHESGQLQRWSENLGYRWQRLRQVFPKYFRTDAEAQAFDRQPERIANRVYANRMGNGPEASGDGWRYRGRGPIQLTGKDNYRACGEGIGVDLLGEPEQLESPDAGCMAAGWFWNRRGLNALADDGDFETITKRINGGLIGLEEREAFWERAKAVLGVAVPALAGARAGRAKRARGKPAPAATARGSRKRAPAGAKKRRSARPRKTAPARSRRASPRTGAKRAARGARTKTNRLRRRG